VSEAPDRILLVDPATGAVAAHRVANAHADARDPDGSTAAAASRPSGGCFLKTPIHLAPLGRCPAWLAGPR